MLLRVLTQPTFRQATMGTLLLAAFFAVIPVLDPSAAERLPGYEAIFFCLLVVLLPLYPTWRLVSGRLSLNNWARFFFWSVIAPWGIIIGYSGAFIPEYTPVLFLLFVGGGGVGVGIMPRWTYLANTAVMVIIYLIGVHFRNPALFLTPGVLLPSAAVLLGSLWIGQASDYYLKRNKATSALLRTSRRDKRLVATERQKSEQLLLNILPPSIAAELKREGHSKPVLVADATVLFTDFEGFTKIAESLRPEDLVLELDRCFSYFDTVIARHKLEKLKTIGDSYMCAGGVPTPNGTHAIDAVLAGLEIQAFMNQSKAIKKSQGLPYWELRLGIHSGPLVAGVIGEKKFAYDVWGDTVNTASRCESSGVAGRINISQQVRDRIDDFFVCSYRGKIPVKHKGEIDMYFVESIRPHLARDSEARIPGPGFHSLYAKLVLSENS
ncbi:MAG: adenylate/guanylate cyclase domain-containing protein [Spirochaetales bacterium]|nr:adenylate/guanylate cyclase domain-containing protein [Spirochaetales bacterium]